MVKAIVFDFDGVITVRGEGLKEEAWEILAGNIDTEEAGKTEEFINKLRFYRGEYGQGKGKGSRYDILEKSLESVFGYVGEKLKNKVSFYSAVYDKSVQAMILDDGLLPDTREALKELSDNFPLYVNSASPEEAVRFSIKKLGLGDFFKGVYGQPSSKTENLQRVAEREGITDAKDIVFVGDSNGDEEAARQFGCRFIGFANDWNLWKDKTFPLISHLKEIKKHL